jgi:hypothetical protein
MQVAISKARLTAGVKGAQPVLEGELYAAVKPDDCYWNVSDGKVLEITLQKARPAAPSPACWQSTKPFNWVLPRSPHRLWALAGVATRGCMQAAACVCNFLMHYDDVVITKDNGF